MIVSSKGRYALRVMVALAQRQEEGYTPLKDIAESEGISRKYLESIMTILSKADFVGVQRVSCQPGSNNCECRIRTNCPKYQDFIRSPWFIRWCVCGLSG